MLVANRTPFLHGTRLTSRRPPQPEMVLVVRGTFRVVQDGVVQVIEGLDQGFLTGERFSEDELASLGECIYPGDFADYKLNAEVMLRGSCYPPGGRAAVECPVRFAVGRWKKELMVYGDRRWERGFSGAKIGEPEPFTRMPLDYARAFGGPGWAPNPVGRGFGGEILPNVEALGQLITARGQTPPPGNFGPINPAWPQRAGKRGTRYDRRWQEERAPYHAEDLDWSYFSAAPADQQIERFLRGDEEVRLQNLHPEHAVLATRLPGRRIRAFVKDQAQSFREIPMALDTLFVEPDAGTLKLTWRGVVEVREDDFDDVRTVYIAAEPLADRPMPPELYKAELEAFEKDPTGVLAKLPPGLAELWERREKEQRGEKVDLPAPDPSLDPVSRELSRKFGPLISKEDLAQVGGAMARIEQGGGKDGLERSMAAAAAAPKGPPSMKLRRPGRLPDPGLRPKMREIMAQAAELRAMEKRTGQPIREIDQLEAVPRDPRWKQLDPTYEPPGPLSTDPPGPGADLAERDFTDQDLTGIDLSGANLERANLTRTRLRGARLRGAKLSRAVLYLADLTDADLGEADLTLVNAAYLEAKGADFTKAKLDEAFFKGADLSGAKLESARAEYAIFEGADLSGVRARGIVLDHADLSRSRLEGASLPFASAALALFGEVHGCSMDLSDAEIGQASFVQADLAGARLVGAKGVKAFFMKAKLDGADLGYADLQKAHLTQASATGARFYGANLREARLYRTDLTGADLSRANLMAVDGRKAVLERARLVEASLYDAKLIDIRGAGMDLTGAKLGKAIVEPA